MDTSDTIIRIAPVTGMDRRNLMKLTGASVAASAQALLSHRTLLVGTVAVHSIARVQADVPADRKGAVMRLRFIFADQDFTATLEDNLSSRDLFSMLPFDLKITDYSTNEKIAYLPRKLSEKSSGLFDGEEVGDLCYYAPWGNLALFHGSYRWSRGLIWLGRLDQGAKPLLVRGEHPLRLETL